MYMGASSLILGRVLEANLNTERGVASCGGGLEPLSREARDPASRALRPGREELAVTDPDASPVRQARDRSLKSPRWSAGRRASRVMGRKAPRQGAWPAASSAGPRVSEHPYVSRRSATLRSG